MLGYAECPEDLAKSDELSGVLRTGDLARQDSEGFFYITGRMKRFLKLFGKRFNLAEVEQIVQERFGYATACFGRDDLLMVAVEASQGKMPAIADMLSNTIGVPKSAIKVEAVASLPRTLTGKIDYQALPSRNERQDEIVAGEPAR
jgi:acyl-coenzyme A synthetase/AMP-(fatty) acid ligase